MSGSGGSIFGIYILTGTITRYVQHPPMLNTPQRIKYRNSRYYSSVIATIRMFASEYDIEVYPTRLMYHVSYPFRRHSTILGNRIPSGAIDFNSLILPWARVVYFIIYLYSLATVGARVGGLFTCTIFYRIHVCLYSLASVGSRVGKFLLHVRYFIVCHHVHYIRSRIKELFQKVTCIPIRFPLHQFLLILNSFLIEFLCVFYAKALCSSSEHTSLVTESNFVGIHNLFRNYQDIRF